jgi:hypothetical protein
MGNLKRAYQIFCTRNNVEPVDNKVLRKFMIQQGHKEGTGYACQRSGQSYLRNLYVPGNGGFIKYGGFHAEEEISMTTRYNQLLVRIGEQYYQNNGAELQDISDDNIEEVTLWRIRAIETKNVPVDADIEELTDEDGLDRFLEQKEYYSKKEDLEDIEEGGEILEDLKQKKAAALLNESEAEDLEGEGPTELGEDTDLENHLAEELCSISEETKKLLANLDFDVEKAKEDFAKKKAGEA